MKKSVLYIIGIRTETSQIINAAHRSIGIYLFVYSIYTKLSGCLFV